MISYKVYIGLDNFRSLFSKDQINIEQLTDYKASNISGGFTRWYAVGGWWNDGTLTQEESLVYEIIARPEDRKDVQRFAEHCRKFFDQTEVLVTETEITSWSVRNEGLSETVGTRIR